MLVVVNGAIASGKNAVARALAGVLEERGRPAAAIDLDDLWLMLEHQVPRSGKPRHWLLARRAAAVLTDEFFRSGIDAVVVHGPFFTFEERDAYLRHVRTEVKPRFVTLRVSFEESLRRAQSDLYRTVSRDRSWLAQRYQAIEALFPLLPDTDLIVDTDGKTPREVASTIAATVP